MKVAALFTDTEEPSTLHLGRISLNKRLAHMLCPDDVFSKANRFAIRKCSIYLARGGKQKKKMLSLPEVASFFWPWGGLGRARKFKGKRERERKRHEQKGKNTEKGQTVGSTIYQP